MTCNRSWLRLDCDPRCKKKCVADVPTEGDYLDALLDPENALGGHGDWEPERTDHLFLKDDDGCSLMVTAQEVAALVNQAVRRMTPRG